MSDKIAAEQADAEAARDEAELPEGWQQVSSHSRPGQFSYLNTLTGDRFIQRPTEPALPEGWKAKWSEHKGRYYYQNKETGVSSWEPPTADGTSGDAVDVLAELLRQADLDPSLAPELVYEEVEAPFEELMELGLIGLTEHLVSFGERAARDKEEVRAEHDRGRRLAGLTPRELVTKAQNLLAFTEQKIGTSASFARDRVTFERAVDVASKGDERAAAAWRRCITDRACPRADAKALKSEADEYFRRKQADAVKKADAMAKLAAADAEEILAEAAAARYEQEALKKDGNAPDELHTSSSTSLAVADVGSKHPLAEKLSPGSGGGKKSRKRRTKRRHKTGGKKSRKLRKRATIKGGKRKRRRTRRRR